MGRVPGLLQPVLVPPAHADSLYGGDGDDTFYAVDSIADLVLDGGAGHDRANRDNIDPQPANLEERF